MKRPYKERGAYGQAGDADVRLPCYVSKELAGQVRDAAKRSGTSLARFIREALKERVQMMRQPPLP